MRACRPVVCATCVGAGSLLALALAALLLAGAALAEGLAPTVPAASRGEQCVEPVELMRREHMQMLMHQRDRTVHLGVRTKRHSLNECVACHARDDGSGGFRRIDAKGEFCASCHDYAAVKIDCFECHAAKPFPYPRASARRPGAAGPAQGLAVAPTAGPR